jgi:hypothetical protein
VAVGAWALAEASIWVIVPDVLAALLVLFVPRRTTLMLAAVIVGAALGAICLSWLTSLTVGVGDVLVALPGISDSDLAHVSGELRSTGPIAFLTAPLQAMPVKLYIHEATMLGMPLPAIVGMTVLNRMVRVGIVLIVAATIGTVLRGPIERRPLVAAAIYCAIWVAIYAYLFASDAM